MTKQGSGHHAPSYRLAMFVAVVSSQAFERMAKGVAKIQDLAQTCFAFVFTYDAGFDLYATRDDVLERAGSAAKNGGEVFFQEDKEFRVANDPILDDFRQPTAEVTWRQGGEHVRIGEDAPGRIKCADEILPFRKVYAGLTTQRTVHLGDQRRWDVYEHNTAQVGCGNEPGHVSHNATTNSDKEAFAIRARTAQ